MRFLQKQFVFLSKISLTIGLKFSSIALGILTYRWINQYFTSKEFAELNVMMSYITVIMGIIHLGIPTLIQKHYTNSKTNSLKYQKWTQLNLVRFFSFFFGFLILFLFQFIFNLSNFELLFILFCTQFTLVVDLSYRSVLDVYNQSWKYSLTDLFGKVLLISSLYIITNTNSITISTSILSIYLIFNLISVLIPFLIDFFWHFKKTQFKIESIGDVKSEFKPMMILGLSTLLAGTFMTTDKLFLRNFGFGDNIINSYSNAYKLFELSLVIPGLSMPIIASKLMFKIEKLGNNIERIKFLSRTLKLVSAIGSIVGLIFYLLSPYILRIIDPYNLYTKNSILYLIYLAVSLTCAFGSQLISYLSIFYGKEKYELIIYILHTIIGLSLYYILISKLGGVGAAISTMIIFIQDFIFRLILLFRMLPKE
jgi:O-antigen/teichoic acid export membrane protein